MDDVEEEQPYRHGSTGFSEGQDQPQQPEDLSLSATNGSPTMSTGQPGLAASHSSATAVISVIVHHDAPEAALPQIVDTAMQATTSSFDVGVQVVPVTMEKQGEQAKLWGRLDHISLPPLILLNQIIAATRNVGELSAIVTMWLLVVYSWSMQLQCENLFTLVMAFIVVRRDEEHELMSILGHTYLARDDDKLVGLKQSYQAQSIQRVAAG